MLHVALAVRCAGGMRRIETAVGHVDVMLGNVDHIDEWNGKAEGQNEDEQHHPGHVAIGAGTGEIVHNAGGGNGAWLRDMIVVGIANQQ